MTRSDIGSIIEDHALERVPDGERESWLAISWNTLGLITTLVIMFFGAVVCFVAGEQAGPSGVIPTGEVRS